MGERKVRIGIDVGGTFTHAVAIESSQFELIGQVKVPTTHTAEEGVAKGIIDSLNKLLTDAKISSEEVNLIAHSTTQATNALLEGDVAPVGIIGMGKGMEKIRAKSESQVGDIELAPKRFLKTYHRFLDTGESPTKEIISQRVDELITDGAKVIVAAESFSVDDPKHEIFVLEVCAEKGVPATASHEISQLYGLKVRTRTAVINASMLLKMMETANMTELSVRKAGIKAPLMIMRSDGGVMDIAEMRKRPILTMLSGPAAGVAAALMYARISDGIFLEVGGTSTDISAIQNGRALIKTAEVGGHRVYLRTLDVRTVGIAGGSMVRIKNGKIEDVGPRSAHIAGLTYASFSSPEDFIECELKYLQPKPNDPEDYIFIEGSNGVKAAITPTCASNRLGYIKVGNYAVGNDEAIDRAFVPFSRELHSSHEKAAEMVLEKAAPKCIHIVKQLLHEYKLDTSLVSLIGGGGGASAIVPFVAKKMDMKHEITNNAAVISAIGVALALVRDTIERNVINPTSEDILKIRKEAEEAVQRMGASPDTIEVQIEMDAQKNLLRATASGSTEMRTRDLKEREIPIQQRKSLAAQSMQVSENLIHNPAKTEILDVYMADVVQRKLFGLYKQKNQSLRVVDREGIIRLQMVNGAVLQTDKQNLHSSLKRFIEENTSFGDAGRLLPDTFILYGGRILDLSGLLEIDQIIALANAELASLQPDSPVVFLVNLRN